LMQSSSACRSSCLVTIIYRQSYAVPRARARLFLRHEGVGMRQMGGDTVVTFQASCPGAVALKAVTIQVLPPR